MRAFVSLILPAVLILTPLQKAWAELRLDPPERLLERAAQGKHELRDVINEIDQQLSEMRDQRTFDQYFYILTDLKRLAGRYELDTIYPHAVTKLGHRMVLKGVNWLDVVRSSRESLLYYHEWMEEPQPAFAFLYASELRIYEEKSYENLKTASGNLEALLLSADDRWPFERSLRLLYRSVLSQLATNILKDPSLGEQEALHWIGKIYLSDAMKELVSHLQVQTSGLRKETRSDVHWLLMRLARAFKQARLSSFGATEQLINQIGDTSVDLVLKSMRFEEKLSHTEFEAALSLLKPHHLSALAQAWKMNVSVTSDSFASYYIHRSLRLIERLRRAHLLTEAEMLSSAVAAKATAISARREQIEGSWTMVDQEGKGWRLVIAFVNEENLVAALSEESSSRSRGFLRVARDLHNGGYVATESGDDAGDWRTPPLRIFARAGGALEVEDLAYPGKPRMRATRLQSFPDLLAQKRASPSDVSGLYEGEIHLPAGGLAKVTLVITKVGLATLGTMRSESTQVPTVVTFNIGFSSSTGVVYLTRSPSPARSGRWIQLRGEYGFDNVFRGHVIYGHGGMAERPFELKKVRELAPFDVGIGVSQSKAR